MYTNYKTGKLSEWFAGLFFILKGYKILQTRFKTKVGEIDLLVSKGNALIAVEVKFRKNAEDAPYAISCKQAERIKRTLTWAQKKYPHYIHLRCDTLLISYNKWPIHIQNAF